MMQLADLCMMACLQLSTAVQNGETAADLHRCTSLLRPAMILAMGCSAARMFLSQVANSFIGKTASQGTCSFIECFPSHQVQLGTC